MQPSISRAKWRVFTAQLNLALRGFLVIANTIMLAGAMAYSHWQWALVFSLLLLASIFSVFFWGKVIHERLKELSNAELEDVIRRNDDAMRNRRITCL